MATKRVVLLGIDGVALDWLESFLQRGVMPTVQRLIERGTLSPMTSFYPVDTGTNWASIVTGASPLVHGCNMHMHVPGDPLDRQVSSFPSGYLRAEPLWLTVQRAGGTAAVFDYPHSYPHQMADRLLHVGEDGRPDNAIRALQEVRAYTTQPRAATESSVRQQQRSHLATVSLAPLASARPGGSGCEPPPLMTELPIQPGPQSRYQRVASLWAVVWPGSDGRYDRVTVHASPDPSRSLATLRPGERSAWRHHTFATDQGPVDAAFQAKLLRLSADGGDLHLYLTEIYPTADFAHPADLAAELLKTAGPFVAQPTRQQVVVAGASDIGTFVEEHVASGAWLERALRHVLGTRAWDVCVLKWHAPDYMNHLFAYATESRHPLYDPAREEEGWRHWDAIMAQADRLVGAAWEAAGPRAVLALTSDHGSGVVPPGGAGHADLNPLLEQAGWLVRDGSTVNWQRTRGYGYGSYVWLNVRGRDPGGIVEPGAPYRRERERLIEMLLAARDALTGAPLLRTVLPIEDAAPLGIGGDRTGDIFIQPWHAEAEAETRYRRGRELAADGRFGTWDWPAVNSGTHHPHTFVVLAGPGIRAGYRRERAAMLNAIAPTLSLAAGLPVPAHADGAALWDAL